MDEMIIDDPTAPAEGGIDTMALVAALRREFDAAESEWEMVRAAQDHAHHYYEGKPFGNELDGRSQIVMPDVQEAVDSMAVAVLRTFVSGDRVVEFEATDEADEELAEEATAAIGYSFMHQQDGYRILYDWCVSGLLERYSVAKTMIVEDERVIRETAIISDPVELEALGGEIEGIVENEDGTLTVSLKIEKRERRSVEVTVPAEEFRFSPRARHEDDADYLAHVSAKTRSELVGMGFDREQVYGLPAHGKPPEHDRDSDNHWAAAESTPALEEVMLCEEYARIDVDDDGIAERVKVFRVENEILMWADGELAVETIEEQPFSVFCPFPRPNRMVGWSLADKVMDIQLARSTVARQLFDGMYNANMPRLIVSERGSTTETLDDILSPIPGAPIRVKDATAVVALGNNFDVGKSMQVLEWMSREGQARSGTVRSAQVLDADTLNEQSATEFSGNREDNQVKQEFVARNLGNSFSRLSRKKYRRMKAEGEPFKIKVDGQYKLVDPGKWPEDINVSVKVGLGTGSRDKRIQARMMLAPLLAEGAQTGKVEDKHLFRAIDGLVRDTGLGKGDDFWTDPDAPPEIDPQTGQPVEKQEQPDPAMMAMQAEQQREDAKLKLEEQKATSKAETDRAVAEARIALMREETAAKLELESERAEAEARMNLERMAFEQGMAERQALFNERMAMASAERAAASQEATIGKNRPGGDLAK